MFHNEMQLNILADLIHSNLKVFNLCKEYYKYNKCNCNKEYSQKIHYNKYNYLYY